jgi:hypothetical protein
MWCPAGLQPAAVDLFVGGPGGSDGLWRSYGYTSRDEAKGHLDGAILDYVESEPRTWSTMLSKQLDVVNVRDKRLRAQLLIGTVRFAQNAEGMIPVLRAQAG